MRRLGGKPKEGRGISRAAAAILMFALFLISAAALEAYRCAHGFITVRYRIGSEKLTAPVRVAMLSDLHESEFGPGNADLIEAVRGLSPDLILCVGDMASRGATERDLEVPVHLMRELCRIAPVYVSPGNHEADYVKDKGVGVYRAYERAGAALLDRRFEDLVINGQRIRLGGIFGYCFPYGQSSEAFAASSAGRFISSFEDTDSFKLLMCHKPTDYCLESEKEYFLDPDVDLVLSGHTHGGLWRLPFVGTPFLPQQGFFPKLDHGQKQVGGAQMIIGAGLGHKSLLFRLFDPCELVLIELAPLE